MKVKVYIASIEDMTDEFYEEQANALHPLRQEKIRKLRYDKDKKLSALAGYLIKNALLDAGVDYDKLQFSVNPYGKPYVENSDIQFNASHAGDYAMCVVASVPVGCDIEFMKPIENGRQHIVKKQMANKFLSEEEYKTLMAAGESEFNDMFYRYWTAKESIVKCIGKGINIPMSDVSVDFLTGEATIPVDETYSVGSMLNGAEDELPEASSTDKKLTIRCWVDGDYHMSVCLDNLENEEIEYIIERYHPAE